MPTTRAIRSLLLLAVGMIPFLVLLAAVMKVRPDYRPIPLTKHYYARYTAGSKIDRYLSSQENRKLQIGAGTSNFPGWLNTDIEPTAEQAYLDASKVFPLPDKTMSYVYSEHVIEHLTLDEGLVMLKECHRVLAPGGKVRIATPDLKKFVDLFQTPETEAARQYIEGKIRWHDWPRRGSPPGVILNFQMRWFGHQYLYDPATLRDLLTSAGFGEIVACEPGQSTDPQLRGLEIREKLDIADVNRYETMVLEATRI